MLSIGLKDVLDIVLVALLLYYIYRLMKESSLRQYFQRYHYLHRCLDFRFSDF